MKQSNFIFSCTSSRKKSLALTVLLFVLTMLSFDAFAQSTGTLNGKIIDAETGEPLLGAALQVQGTKFYAISDIDGNYRIDGLPEGSLTVECSYLSYKTQIQEATIVAGQDAILDFNLQIDLLQMDAVVVTGVVSRNSKAVSGITVQRINADALTDKSTYNGVDELLSGKIAGVSLQKSGGGFGSGTRFIVRSGAGINGNGQPLIFIDGVRMDNNTFTGTGGDGRGTGGISSLVGLNPEDIENVEILKGPAGSASYGTGAANGVVLITTKRGSARDGWEVNYKATVGFHEIGGVLDERNYRNHEFLRSDVFETGAIFKNSFNVSGGNEVLRSFFSVDYNKEDGITPDNSSEQTSTRFNLDYIPSSKFNLRASSQYSKTEISFPQRGRGDGEFGALGFNPANYDERFDPTRPSFYDASSDLNFIDNFIASFEAKYAPFAESDGALKGLSAGLTVGIINRNNNGHFLQRRTTEEVEGQDTPGEVRVANRRSNNFTFTSDIAYQYRFGKFTGSSSIGSQIFSERTRDNFASGEGLPTGFGTLDAASTIFPPTENANHFKSAGIFTSNDLSYDDKYFATLMVRNDYASVLGSISSSIVYPAASFMVRWDNFDWTPELFSLLKTRVAYGETGTLPQRTDGIPILWSPGTSQYGVGVDVFSTGNPNLEPERVKQFEVGLEAEVANFGLEVTYYKNNATKSIVPRPSVSSSGLSNTPANVNIGSVEGSGVELALSTSFAGKALGGWRANFTLLGAYQENTVTDLGSDGQITGGPGGGKQVFRSGLPRGAYYNSVTLGALFSDGTNVQEVDYLPNFGEVVPTGELYGFEDSDGDVFLGTNTPEWTSSFSTNVSIGNFNFYALLEAKTGFVVYNEQTIDQIFFGLDTDFFDGIGTNYLEFDRLYQALGYGNFNTGATVLTPGTQAYIDAADQFATLSPFNDANGIQVGDFIKLREISVVYDFKKIISKSKFIKGLSLGIAGSNIFTWYKRKASLKSARTQSGETIKRWMAGYSGLDSESHAGAFTNGPSTGVQSGQLPPSRTFTSFLTLKF